MKRLRIDPCYPVALVASACTFLTACALTAPSEQPQPTAPGQPQVGQVGGRFVACTDCAVPTPKTFGRAPRMTAGIPVSEVPPAAAAAMAEQEAHPRPKASAPVGRRLERASLQFALDRSDLAPGALRKLDDLMPLVAASERIRVVGFTDDRGGRAVNDAVAAARAASVHKELKRRLAGSKGPELVPVGMPMCCYLADNATTHGRARNRRVELLMEFQINATDEALLKRHASLLEGPVGEGWPEHATAQNKGGNR